MKAWRHRVVSNSVTTVWRSEGQEIIWQSVNQSIKQSTHVIFTCISAWKHAFISRGGFRNNLWRLFDNKTNERYSLNWFSRVCHFFPLNAPQRKYEIIKTLNLVLTLIMCNWYLRALGVKFISWDLETVFILIVCSQNSQARLMLTLQR